MRKITKLLATLTACFFFAAVSFSQNVTINYQTYTASGTCDEFNSATNVPATINGYKHYRASNQNW